MRIVTELIAEGTKPRPGLRLYEPRSITIHWIGPYPKQSVHDPINWWVSQNLEASAHFVVKDEDVINCIPITEVAWHCGCNGNYESIGIEVIPADYNGIFSDTTIATLRELIAVLPKVELKRHYDWTKKDCPQFYTPKSPDGAGDQRWTELQERLR